MKKITTLLSLLFISLTVHAEAPTEESINRLLTVTHAEKIMDAVKSQMEPMMKEIERQAEDGKVPNEADQKIIDKYNARFFDIMKEKMSVEKLRPLYVHAYSQAFTQEEVDNLIAFYESPTGRAVINKMPAVMQSVMSQMPKTMEPMIQELQKAGKEMNDEIAAAHKQGAK